MPAALSPVSVLRARARAAHLDRSGGSAAGIAAALVALHGTDPASLHLSVHARQPDRPLAALIAELRGVLDDDRSVLRLLGMRRTLHGVAARLAPAVQRLAAERLHRDRLKTAAAVLDAAGAPPLDALRGPVLDALGDGDLDTDALQARVPVLASRVRLAQGKSYASEAAVARFVLEAMGTAGDVVRARVLGGWRSGRTTWAAMARWAPDLGPVPPKIEAYAALATAWLRAFGPGTVEDLAWWAGLPKGDARAALAALGPAVVEVEVRGWPGVRYALAEQTWSDSPPVGVALLPALDPSGMCWTDRRPFLDPALAGPLFDRSGNLAPTVWLDGRVVGGGAVREGGEVVFRVLDDGAGGAAGAVAEEAARLQEALDGEVVAPRFPSALCKALAAG